MRVIKGFKLANAVLAAALALALVGCGDETSVISSSDVEDTVDDGTTSSDVEDIVDDDTTTSADFEADEYILISSSGEESDIDYSVDYAVGTWDTSSEVLGDVTYEGLNAWEITSGSYSAEEGNWGTVLVFQDESVDDDLSLFNSIDLKLATSGGYDSYKLSISGNGVGHEIVLPVDDDDTGWQSLSIDLSEFALNLSDVDYIAVMGVGGTSGVSKIYITDYSILKDSEISVDSSTEDDFVFKSSDSSVTSNLNVDDNVTFGEWSTGTETTDTTYNELDAWELSTSSSWGSVLALESSDGTYSTDFSDYTNLKLKVASSGNFSGYDVYIGAENGDYSAGNAVEFSLSDQEEWNQIDIDLDSFGADLSNVSQIAVYGIYADGTASSQLLYVTDYIAYDTGMSTTVDKDSSDDKFVFISSTGEDVDIVVDDDDTVHEGNITVGEWSTSTTISTDVEYDGLTSWQITQTSGWGAVLAMMGDTYGEVQSYDLDLNEYSTINFSIAEDGSFSEIYLDILTTTGAECKIALSFDSDWTDVSINIDELPINVDQLSQIVIYGVGNSGDNLYITDFNISK